MGGGVEIVRGTRYILVVYPSPSLPAGSYPVTFQLQSFTPATANLNSDDALDERDYRVIFDALRGPGVQTNDARADPDCDTDTDLRDVSGFSLLLGKSAR